MREPTEREAALFAALPQFLEGARRASGIAERLRGIVPSEIRDRAAMARLPVLRKSELAGSQRNDPPFGGFAAVSAGEAAHVFASPGPLYEPAGPGPDFANFARSLFAAGFRRGDLVYNTFSYHFTPAGTGQTELQVSAIADLKPQGYVGTPSFLKILLEKAAETGSDFTSLRRALVSG